MTAPSAGGRRRFGVGAAIDPSIADAIIILWGWRRLAVAFLAGALSALALRAVQRLPDPLADRSGLRLADRRRDRRGARAGCSAGSLPALRRRLDLRLRLSSSPACGGSARRFLVDADQFAWLMPLRGGRPSRRARALLGLRRRRRPRLSGRRAGRASWSSPPLFAVAEWLRGHLFTGFPWNAFGYALTPTPVMMQSAALVGLWGLTLAALAHLRRAGGAGRRRRRARSRPAIALVACGGAPLRCPCRLWRAPACRARAMPRSPASRSASSSRAIDQNERWQAATNADASCKRYLELSDGATSPERSGVGSATHRHLAGVGLPVLPDRAPRRARRDRRAPAAGNDAHHRRRARRDAGRQRRVARVFNSVYVIGDDGEILAAYDKVHLVPFGEYLPFRGFFEGLGIRQLIASARRLLARAAPAHADACRTRRRSAPLICYEIIFPGAVTEPGNRPGVAPQRHQRCLVRRHARAPPAFPAGARARGRGRPAAGARRQLRHLRDRRPLWPRAEEPRRRAGRASSTASCRSALSPNDIWATSAIRLYLVLVVLALAVAFVRKSLL